MTVFKFTAITKETTGRESITQYIFENKDEMCLATENYLMTTLTNLEENESISITKPIEEVWSFLENFENQIYFYPDPNKIKVSIIDESTIIIDDYENKTKSTYKITKVCENMEKRQIILELLETNVNLPKQKLSISLIKMDDNQCFIIFKHIMLEFIPFDVLMSYSSQKKKILKHLKAIMEEDKKENTQKETNSLQNINDNQNQIQTQNIILNSESDSQKIQLEKENNEENNKKEI